MISFIRQDAKDEFLVLINLSSRRASGSVDVSNAADFEPVKIPGGAVGPVDTHLPDFSLSDYGWCVYHRAVSK